MDNENNMLAGLALAVVVGVGLLVASAVDVPAPPSQPTPAPYVIPIPTPPPIPIPPPVPDPPCPNCPRAADDAGYQPVGLGNEKCPCCRICYKDSCRCTPEKKCWGGCHCHESDSVAFGNCGCCSDCRCTKNNCYCSSRHKCSSCCKCRRGYEDYEVGATVDGESHDGVEVALPLPPDFHTKNVGGSNGAGLCVFCSMKHAGTWCDDPVFMGLFDYMKSYPGGGWPEKVTKMVKQYCKEKGLPEPEYIQVTGKDLSILKEACRLGRMPCVTYSHSPTGRYHGMHISHMVNLVHADDKWFVVLDNNYVTGEKHLEWMTPDEFSRTYAPGWAVINLKPGPPFPPSN